ncbi:hypothetical protein [Devosia pacifica]|nr:hypothetical protein [Devosia pacifica]
MTMHRYPDRGDTLDANSAPGHQLILDFAHQPSLAADDFIVGEGNSLAYERVASFPHWPEPLTVLFGEEKSGKSHLARVFTELSDAIVAPPGALADLARSGGTRPVVIEDVDRAPIAEDALFHLLNQSMRDNRPLLLTARAPIQHWPYSTEDVRSRARLAVALELRQTDDIQLSQMFVKLFGDRQVQVDAKTIAYLVARMERSSAEVVALCELIDRLAMQRGTAITRKIAAEALEIRRHARDETASSSEDTDDE